MSTNSMHITIAHAHLGPASPAFTVSRQYVKVNIQCLRTLIIVSSRLTVKYGLLSGAPSLWYTIPPYSSLYRARSGQLQ